MRKTILRLAVKSYINWLEKRLAPAGKPYLHTLQASCDIVINALVDGVGPAISVSTLDETGIVECLDWVFKTVANAYSGDTWAEFSSHLMRMLATENVSEILHEFTSLPNQTPILQTESEQK